MSLLDTINQIGGALGTVGAGFAGWVATKINEVKASAEKATYAADRAEQTLKRLREELEGMDALKRGIKLEIEQAIADATTPTRNSSPFLTEQGVPTNGELGRRLDEYVKRLEHMQGEILRERGARHALQHQIKTDDREDEQQWRELLRALATIQAQIEVLQVRSTRG